MRLLLSLVILMGFIFLGLLFLLIATLRRKILRPIAKLSGFMSRVPDDEKPVRFQSQENNELGYMIHMMNRMLDELDQKNEQLRSSEAKMYAMEISRRDMEILAYRNQINPHFLYNTLDCISSIAVYHDADDVAKISESLSTMFRYAVKGEPFALVAQEITYVQEYAAIIGYRFMNRISIQVDASPETLRLRTIKLLIQPLVENAVFHGLERQVGPGTVSVRISLDENRNLAISVSDDGIGIPEEALAALRESIRKAQSEDLTAPSSGKSIGLFKKQEGCTPNAYRKNIRYFLICSTSTCSALRRIFSSYSSPANSSSRDISFLENVSLGTSPPAEILHISFSVLYATPSGQSS